jgi:hypothetical protein
MMPSSTSSGLCCTPLRRAFGGSQVATPNAAAPGSRLRYMVISIGPAGVFCSSVVTTGLPGSFTLKWPPGGE